MALRERLIRDTNQPGGAFAAAEETASSQHSFQEMKSRLHRAIGETPDISAPPHSPVSRLFEDDSDEETKKLENK